MLGDEIHQFDLLACIQVKMENEQQQPVIVVTDHSDDIQSSGGKELVGHIAVTSSNMEAVQDEDIADSLRARSDIISEQHHR